MKDKEVEIQVKIENSADLLKFLEKNAKFLGEKRQIDEYYTPAHRDFLSIRPVSEWFRLRNENKQYSMTYKKWYYTKEGRGEYADEYETIFDNLESARKIVTALDCKHLTTVDKTRRKYLFEDYEVAIDNIKNLGDFIEVEYKSNISKNHEEIIARMIKFLKEHNCGKIYRNCGGYPFMLLFPGETKFFEV